MFEKNILTVEISLVLFLFVKMELKDNCGICLHSMMRKPVIRLLPCRHLLHEQCHINQLENQNIDEIDICHICRQEVEAIENVDRKVYKKHSDEDRKRIVSCANRGDDWVALSNQLNIPYKTAYSWVRSGEEKPKVKGGKNQKLSQRNKLTKF